MTFQVLFVVEIGCGHYHLKGRVGLVTLVEFGEVQWDDRSGVGVGMLGVAGYGEFVSPKVGNGVVNCIQGGMVVRVLVMGQ